MQPDFLELVGNRLLFEKSDGGYHLSSLELSLLKH